MWNVWPICTPDSCSMLGVSDGVVIRLHSLIKLLSFVAVPWLVKWTIALSRMRFWAHLYCAGEYVPSKGIIRAYRRIRRIHVVQYNPTTPIINIWCHELGSTLLWRSDAIMLRCNHITGYTDCINSMPRCVHHVTQISQMSTWPEAITLFWL